MAFLLQAVVCILGVVLVKRMIARGPSAADGEQRRRKWSRKQILWTIALLPLVAFAVFLIFDAIADVVSYAGPHR